MTWDVVVVGAGPAGSATALGALAVNPSLRVLLLDRAHFPRDKACGDGVAPHVLDVLEAVGVHDLLPDRTPVRRLVLSAARISAAREMERAAFVVPRADFDARLLTEVTARGAEVRRHRVRKIETGDEGVRVDDVAEAPVVVGADGAHSVVRAAVGLRPVRRTALAIRGYAPTPRARAGQQLIVFGEDRQPSYAWSFDRGDGLVNVGYGEVLRRGREAPTRRLMLDRLDELLPGAVHGGEQWRAHHLPLSSRRWVHPTGRVLLAGDAAGLVNPVTGEGIYYAVATGVLAGRAAAASVADGTSPGRRYRRAVRSLLGTHLAHTDVVSRLARSSRLLTAAVTAAAADQGVFDDLVELGLGRGRLTRRVLRQVVANVR